MFEKILKQITPSEEEMCKISRITKEVVQSLKEEMWEYYNAEIVPVGSAVKGTNLAGNSDIDIFVKFDVRIPEEKFKGEIHNTLKKALENIGASTETNYASHPYVKAKYDGIDLDICPCYNVPNAEHIISAVDRTPFHTEFVNKYLGDYRKPQVRLLKQFLKAHGIYGANEKYQGFSGYLCELLIIRYGSFINVLRSELCEYRFNNDYVPIKYLDPVDLNRNVAAAVSRDAYAKFVAVSRIFLNEHCEMDDEEVFLKFFNIEEDIQEMSFLMHSINHFYLRGINGTIITSKSDSDNEEVIYSTARKEFKKMKWLVENEGFKIIDSVFKVYDKRAIFVLGYEVSTLPKYKKVEGPPIDVGKKAFFAWIDKHEQYYIEDGKLVTQVERKYTNVYDLIDEHYSSAERFI